MTQSMSFEQSLAKLESLVARLESGDLPLDQALAEYEEGISLVRSCRKLLDRAELKIQKLVDRGNGPEVASSIPAELFGGTEG